MVQTSYHSRTDASTKIPQAHSPDIKLLEGDMVFCLLDTLPKRDLSHFYTHYEDKTRGAPL
jgi:hypothetical protein